MSQYKYAELNRWLHGLSKSSWESGLEYQIMQRNHPLLTLSLKFCASLNGLAQYLFVLKKSWQAFIKRSLKCRCCEVCLYKTAILR
jgi:hypothetical protein